MQESDPPFLQGFLPLSGILMTLGFAPAHPSAQLLCDLCQPHLKICILIEATRKDQDNGVLPFHPFCAQLCFL